MKIETTSLELSKKLEGILEGKVESYFLWLNGELTEREGVIIQYRVDYPPRFTACELMKVLPPHFSVYFQGGGGGWLCGDRVASLKRPPQEADTMAEASGQMVVWLDKEGLLK